MPRPLSDHGKSNQLQSAGRYRRSSFSAWLGLLLRTTDEVFPRLTIKGRHHITDSERGVLLNVWVEERLTCYQTDLDGLDISNPKPWLERIKSEILRLP
jgi:hypothetical protein